MFPPFVKSTFLAAFSSQVRYLYGSKPFSIAIWIGSDNKSKSPKDKVCVFCMVQNNNQALYAAVPGVGFMSDAMLNSTVGKHIDKENTLMLADAYKITKKYFEKNGYKHMILLSNVSDNLNDHKPEIITTRKTRDLLEA